MGLNNVTPLFSIGEFSISSAQAMSEVLNRGELHSALNMPLQAVSVTVISLMIMLFSHLPWKLPSASVRLCLRSHHHLLSGWAAVTLIHRNALCLCSPS